MNTKLLSSLAGAALLGAVGVAGADEPVLLTAAQMDDVTAAGNRLEVDVTGDNITEGSFSFDNLPGSFSIATLTYKQTNFSGVVTTSVLLQSDTAD